MCSKSFSICLLPQHDENHIVRNILNDQISMRQVHRKVEGRTNRLKVQSL